MTLFDLVAKLTLDSSDYEKGIGSAKSSMEKFADGASGATGKLNALAKVANKAVDKLLKIGTVAATAAATGFIAFAKNAVSTGMQFDSAMSQVAATMGTTVDQIQELRDFAQEMGRTTVFSATQAAEALNYMALAGYDADKSMKMLPTVLNLAAAGNFDLARASDMVTDAESALGLTTEETAAMVDQMAKAASKSNTSVEQLGEAMLTIGATAKFMSGGTDRIATVLGILADNGIKGSEAGTKLRNMLLKLSSPTKDGAAMMQQLGLEVYDASGNMRDLQDIMLDLNAAMTGMTDEQKVNIISELFNARDIGAVNALLGTSVERWNELGAAIENSAGAAKKMAETQLDNLAGDVTLLKSAAEGAKIAFSDGLSPAIRDVVQDITKKLSSSKATDALKKVGEQVGNVVKEISRRVQNALPKLLSLFDNGAAKLKTFGIALGVVVIAIKAIANPIGAAVTALGLLAAALGLSALTADDASKKIGNLSQAQLDQIEATELAAESYREIRDARDDALADIDKEYDGYEDLWKELQEITDENGNIKAGYEDRANYITGELSRALGIEIGLNGSVIESYQEVAAAIQEALAQKKAYAMVNAAEESYNKAQEQLPEVQESLYQAEKEMDLLQKKQEGMLTAAARNASKLKEEAAQKIEEAGGVVTAEAQALLELADQAMANAQKQVEGLNIDNVRQRIEDLRQAEQDYLNDITAFQQATAALEQGNYEEVAKIFEENTKRRQEQAQRNKEITQEEIDALTLQRDITKAAYERYLEDVANGAVEYDEEVRRQLGEAAANAAHALTEALLEQERAAQEGIERLRNIVGEGYTIGLDLAIGFAKGIQAGMGQVVGAANQVASAAANAMKNRLMEKSPSRLTREFGQYFSEGFSLGIVDELSGIEDAAERAAGAAISGLQEFNGNLIGGSAASSTASSDSGLWGEVTKLLGEIRDKTGGDVVIDGRIVGYMDEALGSESRRKARAYA